MTGQLQDLSALSPGKDAWYPVGLSWLQSWAGSLGQDKPLLPRRESNRSSSFVQPVVKFLHRPSHPRSCRRINMFCVFIIHKRYQTFRTIGSAVQCNFPHSSVQFSSVCRTRKFFYFAGVSRSSPITMKTNYQSGLSRGTKYLRYVQGFCIMFIYSSEDKKETTSILTPTPT